MGKITICGSMVSVFQVAQKAPVVQLIALLKVHQQAQLAVRMLNIPQQRVLMFAYLIQAALKFQQNKQMHGTLLQINLKILLVAPSC